MTYSDKLKSPKWQKKRLKILERDNWTCRGCQDKESQLQIHHLRYYGNPWEAKDDDLLTLCESCHTSVQCSLNTIKDALVEVQRKWTVEGIDEIERIVTQLKKLDPISLLAVRKMVMCRPDYSKLLKMFKHG